MSSEHATEQVALSDVQEGDMLQDPRSGKWIKITQTTEATERYRVYHGDGGEVIDSRFVTGLVNRQVRE